MTGHPAKPGANAAQHNVPPRPPREDLIKEGKNRFLARKQKPDEHDDPLWQESQDQFNRGWLDGLHSYNTPGRPLRNVEMTKVNQAFQFCVQEGAKLRSVDDIESSETSRDKAIRNSLNLPPRGQILQISKLLRELAFGGRLSMAESDYADVYKQLPLRGDDEDAAAATLRNPEVREFYGFIFKTRHFVAVAAVLRYASFSSLRASLVCPLLKLPSVGFF